MRGGRLSCFFDAEVRWLDQRGGFFFNLFSFLLFCCCWVVVSLFFGLEIQLAG
jgi:IS4 transposase